MKAIEMILAFFERRRLLRLRERIFMVLMKSDNHVSINELETIINEVVDAIEGGNK